VNTISNVNLEASAPGDWTCERLDTIETTARTLYYVSRLMRYLEVLP
jgi:hypothetical protein